MSQPLMRRFLQSRSTGNGDSNEESDILPSQWDPLTTSVGQDKKKWKSSSVMGVDVGQFKKKTDAMFGAVHFGVARSPHYPRFISLIQLIVLIWLFMALARKFQYTDNDDHRFQHFRNTDCPEGGITNPFYKDFLDSKDKNSKDLTELCHKRHNQFSKFIWVFIDSLAYDQAADLIALFPEHTNRHKIMHHGFKFSTAIYTSYFTGKIPTNYAGNEIFSDNIFYQMKRAGMNMKFVGPQFPAVTLLGTGAVSYFTEIETHNHENTPLEPLRVSTSATKLFSNAVQQKQSLIFTSNLIDEGIHRTGKRDPHNIALINDLLEPIRRAKQFVDEHPDYLLIFNSDHGGSQTGGVNEGMLHGPPDGGNEAWILFYNPNLIPLMEQDTWLDTVDVCGTISQYFVGVNVPLESVGRAASNTDDLAQSYKISRSNTLQLKRLADLKQFGYDDTLFQSAMNDEDIPMAIDKMSQFITSIKQPLINFKKFPLFELIALGLMIACLQFLLIALEYRSLSDVWTALKSDPLGTVLPFFFLYFDLLFLKYDYYKHFEEIFLLYTVAFGAAFLYNSVYTSNQTQDPNNNATNSGKVSGEGLGSLDTASVDSRSKGAVAGGAPSYWMSLLAGLWFIMRFFFLFINASAPFPFLFNYILAAAYLYMLSGSSSNLPSLGLSGNQLLWTTEAMYGVLLAMVFFFEIYPILVVMQLVYLVIFIHVVVSAVRDPKALIYPLTLLLFILATQPERCYLLLVLSPSYYLLSRVYQELPGGYDGDYSRVAKNARKFVLFLTFNIAFESYILMGWHFNLDVQVRAGAIGVPNVETYPFFSGFLMGYHKLGYFFLVAAYFIRNMANEKAKYQQEANNSVYTTALPYFAQITGGFYLWTFFLLKSIILMWTFHLSFWLYKDYLTCFLMTVICAMITMMLGALLMLYNIHREFGPMYSALRDLVQQRRVSLSKS